MIKDLFLSALAIAGAAVLWRNLLLKNDWLNELVVTRLRWISYPLTCGFCFTYWLSFFYVCLFDPLHGWLPPAHIELSGEARAGLGFAVSWMALGIAAAAIRFAYVLAQEAVNHFVHHINPNPNHRH